MVRFLHLRFSCGLPCARLLPVINTRNVAHSLARDLRGRLCRKALRSPCLWEIGRQGRPKICVPSDHHYHGIRDDHHRPPSILPSYRSSSTRNSSFHSHATRACLGGEYGGAAIYVAEHAPDEKRGYWTSYIQTTATIGLFLSLIVILATSLGLGASAFNDWGWRIPFLLSSVLVAAALYIRWRLRETPLFSRLKEMGRTATSPIKESLGRDWRLILLALFGATAGQAVVWYTGQFYALFFLQTIRGVDKVTSYAIVATALALGTPLFIFFGRLSDRIGRKKIIMAGCGLAAATYYPLYIAMTYFSDKASFNAPALTLLVLTQVIYVTMVYGPIA